MFNPSVSDPGWMVHNTGDVRLPYERNELMSMIANAVRRNASPMSLLECSKGWSISAAGKCWAEQDWWVLSPLWLWPDYWFGTQVDSWTRASPVHQRSNPRLWRLSLCPVSSFTPNGLAKISWTILHAQQEKWGGEQGEFQLKQGFVAASWLVLTSAPTISLSPPEL